jgi:hypothetical protein
VARLQLLSERRPSQETRTVVGAALRTATDWVGIALGQSWLDQTRSTPEVTLSTTVCGDTVKVHAGWVPVSRSWIGMDRPAAAVPTTGVTVTSAAVHGPVGVGSAVLGVVVGVPPDSCGLPADEPDPRELAGEGLVRVRAAVMLARPSVEEPPAPSRWAIPKTSANAVASTSDRRNQ